MSPVSIMKMYDDLSLKLGKDSAENIVLLIEQKVNAAMENNLKLLATREELQNAIYTLDQKLESKFGELKIDIANVKTDIANVKTEIGHIKFELLKWVIGLWITNTLMILGLYLRK